ncbi:MAG TPA: Rho termination factor N-terminal domain-containing protein [Vicinamibacteria bacterium]|nr:Rho termination factor N-terminal domain-containing protein [Vicinamibacteria bacterium]
MPRESWTDKEERQYQHIKESVIERGRSEDRAAEVAARTVNKERRRAGKTRNKTTTGTGNPNTALEERGVRELRNRAKELNIEGRSRMTKAELVDAIRRRN